MCYNEYAGANSPTKGEKKMTFEKIRDRALNEVEAWKSLLKKGSELGVDYMTATHYVWAYESIGIFTTKEAIDFISCLSQIDVERRFKNEIRNNK